MLDERVHHRTVLAPPPAVVESCDARRGYALELGAKPAGTTQHRRIGGNPACAPACAPPRAAAALGRRHLLAVDEARESSIRLASGSSPPSHSSLEEDDEEDEARRGASGGPATLKAAATASRARVNDVVDAALAVSSCWSSKSLQHVSHGRL